MQLTLLLGVLHLAGLSIEVGMAKPPDSSLTATERVLLFCVATDTDCRMVVAVGTAQHMIIRGLIERDGSGFAITDQRRARSPDVEGRDEGASLTGGLSGAGR
jgi:hypothetical protein